jgi:hypothetical protein
MVLIVAGTWALGFFSVEFAAGMMFMLLLLSGLPEAPMRPQTTHGSPKKLSNPRVVTVLIALVAAFYAGIDVVPGELDHVEPSKTQEGSDFSLRDLLDGQDHIIRLRRADGRAISELEEEKLIPPLELLDRELKTGNETQIQICRERIKALKIYNDEEVDAIRTREGITHILMQMEATVPLWRHCFRALVAAIFIFHQDLVSSGHPAPALAIEILLPFSPYGHPETTAGRHFDGGHTWLGELIFVLSG